MAKKTEETVVPVMPVVNAEEERVNLFIPKDSGDGEQNKYICVNGVAINVPKGKMCSVKKRYYDAYMSGMDQEAYAEDYAAEAQKGGEVLII